MACSAFPRWLKYVLNGGVLCCSQHLTTKTLLLSEICEAGNRVGVEWLLEEGGQWDKAIFLLCCRADVSAAPPVQLYLPLVTKPTTVLAVLGNCSALLTLSFLWQW